MKRKQTLNFVIALGLSLMLSAALLGLANQAQAQGSAPEGDPLGTAFTYQGRLTDSATGDPLPGPCSLRFTLYQSAAGNDPLGSPQTAPSVILDNGYFSVDLDFGAGAFTGGGRFLEIEVDCGSGYASLSPRVSLNPAPYSFYALDTGALHGNPVSDSAPSIGDVLTWNGGAWLPQAAGGYWSLTGNAGATPGTNFLGTTDNVALELYVNGARALRLEPNAASPNVIGGYSGNSVTAGVYGAAIGGGGNNINPNRVTSNYGAVGGGYGNTASGANATIGGGEGNTASGITAIVSGGVHNVASGWSAAVCGGDSNTGGGDYATVGGGAANNAAGVNAVIGGGYGNAASGLGAAIAGGESNTASATYSAICGGAGNFATGHAAVIGGGVYNVASSESATVGGGYSNDAASVGATVAGGESNLASGQYATIPGGLQATAPLYGQMAYASGAFASPGDAQASFFVMSEQTVTSATWEDLYLDGGSLLLTIPPTRTLTFDILLVGRSSAGESAGYYIWGVAENVGGVTTVWATTVVLHEDDAAWNAQATGIFGNHLAVQVMGNGETIRWVATVRTAEVSW